MSVFRLLAVLLASLTAVAGCSGPPPQPGAQRAPSRTVTPPGAAPRRLSPWWVSTQDYLSGGVLHGNRMLTQARGARPGTIDLVALDRDSGTEVWRHPWSPSGSSDAFAVSVSVVESADDRFAVFVMDRDETDGDGIPFESLVAVRVSDGRVTTLLDQAYLPWPVRRCGPASRRVCAGVRLPDRVWRWIDVDPASGDLRMVPLERPLAVLTQEMAVTRLADGTADPHERLALVRDGRVLWSVDSRETFGAPLDEGAQVFDRAEGDLVVVDVPGNGDRATARTVALRSADGAVVWRRDGVGRCGATAVPPSTRLLMACEGAGRPDTPGARLALVLLDRLTGRTEQSHRIDATTYNVSQKPDLEPLVPPHLSPVELDGRRVLLDGSTGGRTPFEPAGHLCWTSVDAEHRFYPGVRLAAGRRVQACEGADADRTISVDEAEAWGVTDGVTTMLRGGKVHAYRR